MHKYRVTASVWRHRTFYGSEAVDRATTHTASVVYMDHDDEEEEEEEEEDS